LGTAVHQSRERRMSTVLWRAAISKWFTTLPFETAGNLRFF